VFISAIHRVWNW